MKILTSIKYINTQTSTFNILFSNTKHIKSWLFSITKHIFNLSPIIKCNNFFHKRKFTFFLFCKHPRTKRCVDCKSPNFSIRPAKTLPSKFELKKTPIILWNQLAKRPRKFNQHSVLLVMANVLPPNLLEEAIDGKGRGGGRMILVEDSVETTGAFVLHHLLKRALPPNSSDVVVFLSFAYPFSHYDRVLRKMVAFSSSCVSNFVTYKFGFFVTIR